MTTKIQYNLRYVHAYYCKEKWIFHFPFFRIKISNRNLEQPGRTARNPEFRVPTRNSELTGNFSDFQPGTRKNFQVPGWNPEKFPGWNSEFPELGISGFRKFSGYSRGFPHCFPTRKNRDFSGLEPGTRNSGGNPNLYPYIYWSVGKTMKKVIKWGYFLSV